MALTRILLNVALVNLVVGVDHSKIWTEVVVAHFAEDLTWISEHAQPQASFTVYSKADASVSIPAGTAKVVRLPNVGREGHTYLNHIVQNYDNLAPWTVFKQGSSPAQGYVPAEQSSGHMNSGVSLDDYIRPFPGGRNSTFIMTAAAHFPSGLQLTRPGLAINGLEQKPLSTSMCPDKWAPWWLEKLHIYCQKFEPSMMEFYDRFVARSSGSSSSLMLAFPQGGIFALSRSRIHTRPREYYAALMDQVKSEQDPIQGYWLEASWYDIFHPEALQSQHAACEYPSMPDRESVAPYGDMFSVWVQTLKDNNIFGSALRKLVAQPAPSSGPSSVKPPSSVKAPSSNKNTTTTSTSMALATSSTTTTTGMTMMSTSSLSSTVPMATSTLIDAGTSTTSSVVDTATTTFASSVASAEISGSMTLEISNVTAFLEDLDAQEGLAKGIARAAGVPVEYVQLSLSTSRRLSLSDQVSKRRLNDVLKVDYTITLPSDSVADPALVTSALNNKTVEELANVLQQELTLASTTNYAVAVVSKTQAHITSSTTPSTANDDGDSGLSTGSIVGIVLGALFLLPMLLVVFWKVIVMTRAGGDQSEAIDHEKGEENLSV